MVQVCAGVLLALALSWWGWPSWGQPLAPPPPQTLVPNLDSFPLVEPYDLGMAAIDQTGVDAALATMPLPLTGAIALPPGNRPVPWVIILHGRHGGCHFNPEATSEWPCEPEPRFDLGFAYLAQTLAEAGYGVLIPNLNAAFSETYGASADNRNELADQRSGQIIDAHLIRLAQAHLGDEQGFGVALAGRVELGRLAMVGHSMGGGAAALIALRRAEDQQGSGSVEPLEERIAAGLGPIAALVLVSPTRSYAIAQRPDAYQLTDVPTAVIAGGCDRDIFDLSSLYYVETARQQPRTTAVVGILLPGANHHYFNAAVAEDDYYRQPNNAPLCNPQRSRQRLSRVAQERFLSQYTQACLQAIWVEENDDLTTVGMATHRAAPGTLGGQSVLTTLVAPGTQRAPLGQADTPLPDNLTATAGLTMSRCAALTLCDQPARPYPHFPDLLTLAWDTGPQQLQVALETANFSDSASLNLRLAPDPAWALPPYQPAFAVVLRDRQGNAARVEILATVPALHQFEADPTAGLTAPLYASDLRIPLGQFDGVDLTALTSIDLVFDQTPKGKLHLVSLEFVGQADFGF
ncbi:MAG: hypothetical protein AAFW95_03810 [Cyanobacteria bacterium J06638_6]